jgi:hypothetical protein
MAKSFGKSGLLLLPNSAPEQSAAAGESESCRIRDGSENHPLNGARPCGRWNLAGNGFHGRDRGEAEGTTEKEMPTPAGHIASGLLIFATGGRPWRKQAGLLLVLLFFALLPDIDLAFGLVLAGNANAYHHQATHSILFVLAAGWIGGVFFPGKGHTRLFIAAGLVHLGLDILAKDTSAPFGAPLLWPFWSGYIISPLQIFSDVHRSGEAASFIPSLFNRHNFWTVLIETALLAPLGLLLYWRKRRAVNAHE